MPDSYCHIIIHLTFSTKERARVLNDDCSERLRQYITRIIQNNNGVLIAINNVEDHVHILFGLPSTSCVSDFVRVIKTNSSKWISQILERPFAWQTGYGAFSVSHSQIPVVKTYIANQVHYHKKRTFEEELEALLKAHEISPFRPSGA